MANENRPPPMAQHTSNPSKPPVAGAAKPGVPPQPPQPGDPNQPPHGEELAVPLSFWQLPWVQNILPFATSVMIHLSILIIGIVFFYGVKYVQKQIQHQEEVVIPDASMIENGPPGGIPNQGLGNDPNRQAFQDKDPTGGTPQGWAEKKGTSIEMKSAGGGEGDSNDPTIGVSLSGGGIGHGKGKGGGIGDLAGGGDGDGSGALAMFGAPGGGGIGPKGPVFGHGGNAKRIAFVCDASGSMLNKFSTLRRELSNTVQGLRVIQSFNIIFFQEQSCTALDNNQLVMATPENKVKATNYLEDKVTPRGETNPIPGIELAFKQKPELIYILTDGDFPDNKAVLKRITELNRDHKVKINTIAFVGEADTDTEFMKLLTQIAKEDGGVYKFVKESD
ncbi:MAG TPA: VWA domain-containing protein, partial [Tepidisphaeraceae bacterium]